MGDIRKLAAFWAMLLILVPVLAACGGGDDDDPTATSESQDTPSVTAATTGTTEADETTTTEPGGETPEATGTSDASAETPEAVTETPGDATSTTPPAADATPTTPEDDPAADFAFGWNVALRGDDGGAEFNTMTTDMVNESGFNWVRFQLQWSQFEREPDQWDPLGMDRVIDACFNAGINVLLVVTAAPEWALDPTGAQMLSDWGEFEQFMNFVANRYRGKVQAWEIWNEQNLSAEMHGPVRASDYYELLKAGYTGVKSADPEALVLFGGLSPNGLNDPNAAVDDLLYLETIYTETNGDISNYYDILGAHLNSTHNGPQYMWPDNPSPETGWNDDESFYFRRAEQLRAVQLANGDSAKPMWITEFGWTTENHAPGYEYGANNSPEEVAEFLTLALDIAINEWDFTTGAFIWNLNWSTLADPEDELYPWSAIEGDWTPRPAFEAMVAYPK